MRAAVALSNDFFIHPDEIMQYLEQGHRLAFGNGVVYWEFFYGARSWLLPGLIAGVLKLFDVAGFGQPAWYVGGVKLTFCAISLLIPVGMYFFARRHFDETAARAALLAGAFWYELVVFAHKPMPTFIATALLVTLLVRCVHPPLARGGAAWCTAFLAVLTVAIRVQYTPIAFALLGLLFITLGAWARVHLVLAAALSCLAVGVFDAVTWDAGLFASYVGYLRINLEFDQANRLGTEPAHQYLKWMLSASGGIGVLCVPSLRNPRRYGFLLILTALVLFTHSTQPHKEYHYIFAVVPLWLLVSVDGITRFTTCINKPVLVYGVVSGMFGAVSLTGLLNILPYQDRVYEVHGFYTPYVRGEPPVFAAYRYLATASGVKAVWHVDREYFQTPGYYYLHHKIPFYDKKGGPANNLHNDLSTLQTSVSHIIAQKPNFAVPSGYSVEKEFGKLRILRRKRNESPVRRWRDFTPTIVDASQQTKMMMRSVYPDAPFPPANFGIRFIAPE